MKCFFPGEELLAIMVLSLVIDSPSCEGGNGGMSQDRGYMVDFFQKIIKANKESRLSASEKCSENVGNPFSFLVAISPASIPFLTRGSAVIRFENLRPRCSFIKHLMFT